MISLIVCMNWPDTSFRFLISIFGAFDPVDTTYYNLSTTNTAEHAHDPLHPRLDNSQINRSVLDSA